MARAILLLAAVLALAVPSVAFAHAHHGPTHLPPGNSAANEYTESLPTAGGNTPAGGAPTGAVTGGLIPAPIVTQLGRYGASGRDAAALAGAGGATVPQLGPKLTPGALSGPTSSAAGQVIKTLEGSGGGGLGVLLPVILIASLIAASLVGILRRGGPA